MIMKRIILVVLAICILLSGCSNGKPLTSDENTGADVVENRNDNQENITNSTDEDIFSIEFIDEIPDFGSVSNPELLPYIESDIILGLNRELSEQNYFIENVSAIYLSEEYIEEVNYNSKENIFFGYTLSELDQKFDGKRYVFTLGENGNTIVKEFNKYDDSYERMLTNIAVGTGVILICVTVTYFSAGAASGTALQTVNLYFSAAAKGSITLAKCGTGIGAIAGGLIEALKNGGDFESVVKSSVLGATEGLKFGAIFGAIAGASAEAFSQYVASTAKATQISKLLADPNIKEWRKAELRALQKYGGQEQVSYFEGKVVEKTVENSTRPDIVRYIGQKLEAIEVKHYNLSGASNLNSLLNELKREIADRNIHLPDGSIQRIVLDVTGKGYSEKYVSSVATWLIKNLMDVYPNIPIDIVGV